jgi:hypothetical protein
MYLTYFMVILLRVFLSPRGDVSNIVPTVPSKLIFSEGPYV